ncbi:YceK/YidQ family lipoprotein [Aquipseudomonas campi]|uniref:YceK/YidQ family lipoprotein n=1 Tax=Aquipseudomonas campi TaxID=2731681 RepID=A0A6M8G302_9GAMM|nr:YceK/YidQ family lipoprotein [Pseudomonas campi]QKE63535.1 YceK/YidQ family lipoprotein [Pseudomonas campi]
MPHALRTLLLATLAFTLTGCGTFLGRAGEASEGDYYKGVEADMVLLGATSSSGEAEGATVMCYLMVVCPLITLVSVPVDAAVDTLLLPFDLLAVGDEEAVSAEATALE